jgi:hypothetical protein
MKSKQGIIALLLIATTLIADVAAAAENPFRRLGEALQRAGQTSAQQHFPALAGSWLGHATVGTSPYPVFVSFAPGTAPTFVYAQTSCGGPMVSEGQRGQGYRFRLQPKNCSAPPRMQLTPNGTQLKWDQMDARGNILMSAFLSRTDQNQPTHAQAQVNAAQITASQNSPTTAARQRRAAATTPKVVMPGNAYAQQAEGLRMGLEQAHIQLQQSLALQGQAQQTSGRNNVFKALMKRDQEVAQPAATPADVPKELIPAADIQFTGSVSSNANVRAAPETKAQILTTLETGTTIGVSAQFGDWYLIQAIVDNAYVVGYVYHTLVYTDLSALPFPDGVNPTAGHTEIAYHGYSERFQELKELIANGDLEAVEDRFQSQEEVVFKKQRTKDLAKLKKKIGVLRWLERGTLAMDQGLYEVSADHFTTSEDLVENMENRRNIFTTIGGFGTKIGEAFSGNEELAKYYAEGWEKVLMLNYKSLAYLLNGSRQAYNVTRRSIDWQNMEKRKFDEKLREEQEKLETKNAKDQAKADRKVANTGGEQPSEQSVHQGSPTNIGAMLDKMSEPFAEKALSVPSAYVNPFGFYVAGMIQEFDSYEDPSLRDNARISYNKALELNPSSDVLAKAAADMENFSAPRDKNLVHVVVGNGYVPEKKVLTYYVQNKTGSSVPLKLPFYEPVKSMVARVEIHTSRGKKLATLSTVADVEAFCLRQQKDMQKVQVLRAFGAFLVSAYITGTADGSTGLIGDAIQIFAEKRQEGAAPDTRSWMSLPGSVMASRVFVDPGVDEIKIVTFDNKGRRIGSAPVALNPDGHGVVYARIIDQKIYPQASENLWMF